MANDAYAKRNVQDLNDSICSTIYRSMVEVVANEAATINVDEGKLVEMGIKTNVRLDVNEAIINFDNKVLMGIKEESFHAT